MSGDAPKILLTGPPGCGKTTLIRKVVKSLGIAARGFYTEEVRGRNGKRIGFDVVTLDGGRGVLARTDHAGPRVGKYGVDLGFLESVALPCIRPDCHSLIVIDEIGKMECLSPLFTEAVRAVLDSPSLLLGTVARGGAPFIGEVRGRKDVIIMDVHVDTRDILVRELVNLIHKGTGRADPGTTAPDPG